MCTPYFHLTPHTLHLTPHAHAPGSPLHPVVRVDLLLHVLDDLRRHGLQGIAGPVDARRGGEQSASVNVLGVREKLAR
jgi:hypothetical protein